MALERIVSGGQTGVDRAALDSAIDLGIPHGGWCPRGRRAEDGPIAHRYQLAETESASYSVRTGRNVADSDATLIICAGPPRGGTALTRQLARQQGKPCLVVDTELPLEYDVVRRWLSERGVRVLNVAGPRASQQPGIYDFAKTYLDGLFSCVQGGEPAAAQGHSG